MTRIVIHYNEENAEIIENVRPDGVKNIAGRFMQVKCHDGSEHLVNLYRCATVTIDPENGAGNRPRSIRRRGAQGRGA